MKVLLPIIALVLCVQVSAQPDDPPPGDQPTPSPQDAKPKVDRAYQDMLDKIERRRQEMRAQAEELKKKNAAASERHAAPAPAVVFKPCPKRADDAPIHIANASLSNAGWHLMLSSNDALTSLDTRPAGHTIWTPAEANGDTFSAAFANLPQCADIEVRATAADGSARGPFTLSFDTVASLRKQAMRSLRSTPGAWIYLRPYPDENHSIIYFTHLASYRCGLHEVRYSIDSEALDRRWPVPACTMDLALPSDAEDMIELPEKHAFVAVQLVYADDSVSDIVVQRRAGD